MSSGNRVIDSTPWPADLAGGIAGRVAIINSSLGGAAAQSSERGGYPSSWTPRCDDNEPFPILVILNNRLTPLAQVHHRIGRESARLLILPVPCVLYDFSLACSTPIRHNTPQSDTFDEAATYRFEPYAGRTDVVESETSGMAAEVRNPRHAQDRMCRQ